MQNKHIGSLVYVKCFHYVNVMYTERAKMNLQLGFSYVDSAVPLSLLSMELVGDLETALQANNSSRKHGRRRVVPRGRA